MAKRFTRFFAVPVNEDLVIEVEFGITKGLPVPFVVRLMAEPAPQAFTACSLQCAVCD
jgi:hypothetical protein